MLSLETFEAHLSAVMETLVKAAATELCSLLDKCFANANAVGAQQRSAPGVVTPTERMEEESEETPPEGRQQLDKVVLTNQFVSLMEAWTKDAVEKILVMLKVSMCVSEDKTEQTGVAATAEQDSGPKKQSASRSSPQKKKTKGVLKPTLKKGNDHMYCREKQHTKEITAPAAAAEIEPIVKPADAASHETNCGSPCEPEAMLTEPISEPASDMSEEDVIEERADTSASTSKVKKTRATGQFKCPSCGKPFAKKCLMDRHYLTHSKPHLCSECGKRFSGPQALVAHSRRHTGEKLHKCSNCGTGFAYKSTFIRHMRQHCVKQLTTHTCTLCENQFSGLKALQRHRCCALKKTFVCSLCPETFECRQSLADHENLHPGDRDFVCEMCGESFFSLSSLATHRVTHMHKENGDLSAIKHHLSKGTEEKLFSCEVCGKRCSHQSALKHHMLTHTGDRPYICETCGKRCSHPSALQNHMRIHTGLKPGQHPVCNVCGRKFRRVVHLKYHMYTHTGEKPYACNQCEKKFKQPTTLKIHMMTHSGEKKYSCNVCGKKFTHSATLKQHRWLHTGEMPHRCMDCGKDFLYRSDFKKHQMSHLPNGDGPSE